MKYAGFTTFKAEKEGGILTVTFDFGTVNVQGQEMLADLNSLAMRLERDRETKVVVFQSSNPEIWVCHYDTELLKDMSTEAVSREEAELLDLQSVCERISKVPQATIAKLEGFARGGGHELALALDMRFAARGKFKFMQMEVGMGILPCGGGASRMARQTGLGRALEIILSARDFDADEGEALGTINKALEPDEIGPYVDALARRIAQFPAEAINACKQAVYESIDRPIDEALKAEAYWLYQATSKTPAIKRFTIAGRARPGARSRKPAQLERAGDEGSGHRLGARREICFARAREVPDQTESFDQEKLPAFQGAGHSSRAACGAEMR